MIKVKITGKAGAVLEQELPTDIHQLYYDMREAGISKPPKNVLLHDDKDVEVNLSCDSEIGSRLMRLFGKNDTMSRGRSLTARILESPSQERGCILSDILETDVPAKYFLSETQMERLLCKSYQGRRDVGSTPPAESPSP